MESHGALGLGGRGLGGHGGRSSGVGERRALAGAFTSAAFRYWLTVFPQACREIAHWRRRAAAVSDPVLRGLALDAFAKRGNIEGAAAFAVLAPRTRRTAVVRALVALQSVYNYADLLSEQRPADPVADARRLHEALLAALDVDRVASDPDWYEHHSRGEDGYLAEMIATCRAALGELPSYSVVATSARTAAERIVMFQSLSAGGRSPSGAGAGVSAGVGADADPDGVGVERDATKEPDSARNRSGALERWAREQTPAGCGLSWWETAAAGGSSLGLHALVALAAHPALEPREATAVEDAYFPWIGGLHSLLDSVVDEIEDADTGQLSLCGCYASRVDARARMRLIAVRAMRAAQELPRGGLHAVVMAGMVGFYASAARVSWSGAAPVSSAYPVDVSSASSTSAGLSSANSEHMLEGVVEALGPLARPTLLVFGVRRRFTRVAPSVRVGSHVAKSCGWHEEEDADARAA